jgi:hypothetical protein
MTFPYRPAMPPDPFIPRFDPPHVDPPSMPRYSSGSESRGSGGSCLCVQSFSSSENLIRI